MRKMKAEGPTPPEGAEVRTFPAMAIVIDGAWNCRRVQTPTRTDKDDVTLTDAELEESIRTRGVLEYPRVHLADDGQPIAMVGFRRILACRAIGGDYPVPCIVHRFPEDATPATRDLEGRYMNLTENLHRQNLRPWEVADAMFRLREAHPEVTRPEVCAQLTLAKSYALNLLRVREKACPQFWDLFCRNDASIRTDDAVKVCQAPHHEQMLLWAKLRAARVATKQNRRASRKAGLRWVVTPIQASGYLVWLTSHAKPKAPKLRTAYLQGARDAVHTLTGKAPMPQGVKLAPLALVKARKRPGAK